MKKILLLGVFGLFCFQATGKNTIKATIVTHAGTKEIDMVIREGLINHADIYHKGNMRLDANGRKNYEQIMKGYEGLTGFVQNGIQYIDDNGKKNNLKPNQAKELSFSHNGEEYHFYSRSVSEGKDPKKYFLPRVIDGPLELYIFEIHRSNKSLTSGGNYFKYYVAKQGRFSVKEIRQIAIRKDLRPLVQSCKEIRELMEDTKRMMKEGIGLIELVQFYNENCGEAAGR